MSPSNRRVLDSQACLDLPLLGIKLIEASAGTGKTYTISNLYLRYVLEGYRVNQILVVTFTNAATEELRGRVRERLFEALCALENGLNDDSDPFLSIWFERYQQQGEDSTKRAADLLRLAVRTMDEAAIYTIHGFCQRVLSDYAFDSGQAFSLELLDDDSQLWAEALRDWWRKTTYEMSRDAVALFDSAVGGFDGFVKSQMALRNGNRREKLPRSIPPLSELMVARDALAPELQKLQVKWATRRDDLLQALIDSKALGRGKTTPYYLPNLEANFIVLDAYFAGENLIDIPQQFSVLCADIILAHNKPSKIGSDPQLEDGFFGECQSVWTRVEQIQTQLRIAALLEANDFALAHVDRSKRSNNTLAFSDQLSRVLDGLRNDAGAVLAHNLRANFPIAMIDEFQDTDNIQYGIFRAIYVSGSVSGAETNTAMIMIGDPKQAIYSFRGGDIFAYAEAKLDAGDELYTLDTNWRSVPKLIEGVNTLFESREDSFVYAPSIEFQPVLAANKKHALLTIDGQEAVPLSLWSLPLGDNEKPLGKEVLRASICQAVSAEVAALLSAAREGKAKLGDEALQAGNIAILVRSNNEGENMRRALAQFGVDAVAAGRNRVFDTEEARGLELILEGVVHSHDRRRFRSALGSSILGLDYFAIAQIIDSSHESVLWQERFKSLKSLWQTKGFMAMFYVMLHELGVGLRMASGDLAERRLTNMLHLAELLQQNSKIYPGFESLLSWYKEQLEESGQEAELRLESDQALVKIVTIHASKGLEYPVVFVPFMWDCRPYQDSNSGVLPFHDETGKAFLDLGDKNRDGHLCLADKERLAEDVRVLYVALTRARSKLYLVWGNGGNGQFNHSPKSALAWLLHSTRTSASLAEDFIKEELSPQKIEAGLSALVARANNTIEVTGLPMSESVQKLPRLGENSAAIQAASFAGSIANDWRISSFSSLTRDVHQSALARSASARSNDPILEFEAGAHVGLFMHHLLEDIDFDLPIEPQAEAKTKQYAPLFTLESAAQPDIVARWLTYVVNTPLNDSGMTLAQIPKAKRLSELSFDFGIGRVNLNALNTTLSRWAQEELPPIGFETITGMITGVIDLIFEHDGRYYVADYKSNYLGAALEDYSPSKLRRAMFDRRYDLQYLLYVVALHRYLRQRIENYDYNQSMGGVYYLFLRGMRPESGTDFGIYFDLPPLSLIDELDNDIFGLPQALESELKEGSR